MNKLDKDYQRLMANILDFGHIKQDRTGANTQSILGATIRHKMSDGFPLITTKKMHWPSIVIELLWFLRGDTNIKYLLDNKCNIWNGDAYKNYKETLLSMIAEEEPLPIDEDILDMSFVVPRMYTQDRFIEKIKESDKFAKMWGELGPIYGKQWRDYTSAKSLNIDQITRLICDVINNPDSRRLLVNAYNPDEIDDMVLPPCHYAFQLYTRSLSLDERTDIFIKRGGELSEANENSFNLNNIPKKEVSLLWTQRSCDVFLGLPFNIASYGLLLTIIADVANMIPGELIGNLGDTHLYLNHIEQAKEQLNRTPYKLPSIILNNRFINNDNRDELIGAKYDRCIDGPHTYLINKLLNGLVLEDFSLVNYECHESIKAPLNN